MVLTNIRRAPEGVSLNTYRYPAHCPAPGCDERTPYDRHEAISKRSSLNSMRGNQAKQAPLIPVNLLRSIWESYSVQPQRLN